MKKKILIAIVTLIAIALIVIIAGPRILQKKAAELVDQKEYKQAEAIYNFLNDEKDAKRAEALRKNSIIYEKAEEFYDSEKYALAYKYYYKLNSKKCLLDEWDVENKLLLTGCLYVEDYFENDFHDRNELDNDVYSAIEYLLGSEKKDVIKHILNEYMYWDAEIYIIDSDTNEKIEDYGWLDMNKQYDIYLDVKKVPWEHANMYYQKAKLEYDFTGGANGEYDVYISLGKTNIGQINTGSLSGELSCYSVSVGEIVVASSMFWTY